MKGRALTTAVVLTGLIPGSGHMLLGRPKKALGLFLVFASLVIGSLLSDWFLIKILMVMVYLSITIPAWVEAYQIARYGKNKINTDARWYTIMLLLFTGFSALPLLWQNRNFSIKSKILWSIAVPALAIAFFSLLIAYRDSLETIVRGIFP
jgi:hypothetical protein